MEMKLEQNNNTHNNNIEKIDYQTPEMMIEFFENQDIITESRDEGEDDWGNP